MPKGKLITNGVKLQPHEEITVEFLIRLGKDIELIPPSNTPHNKRGDLLMDGLIWETKSPVHSNRRAVERVFYAATLQAENLIFDLRRNQRTGERVRC